MRVFIYFLLFLSFSFVSKAQNIELDVEKYTLKNGLRVVLHVDKSIPLYSYHQWYLVGSRDELPLQTGLAHFFEHLMFKGTTNFSEGEFDKVIEENGGRNNAFTTREYTGYYANMPTGSLEELIRLEADRMINLNITEKNVKSEREVVKEERRMRVENSPFGLALEALFSNSYSRSSYRWPVIGYMRHLENASLKDFRDFYKKYYSPNNSVIVIAGNFNPKKAKRWIKKYFSKIKPQEINRKEYIKETWSRGSDVKIKKPFGSSTLAVSTKGASINSNEAFALDLISHILTSGTASRLYIDLVDKKKLALSIDSWNFTPKGEGLLMLFASMAPGASVSRVKTAIEYQLAQTGKKGVSIDELNRAKKAVNLSNINQLKTISGKARGLAVNEILFGDYKRLFTDVSKYQNLELEYVNSVARKYLLNPKLNFVEVGP